ncbi:MAG: tetratricopeptide repeat protein [Rhodanobacter sp.]|nr:MAG: tetratricopeptide repeat protein [Rhodanobacter sp.]TAM08180.1 MAG: tetratricopeptide repeat protein [Rhodanobacter sp.]TAM36042.1 MAG: tetratricopeptide repeat protein [Rhodanobacter sp.]
MSDLTARELAAALERLAELLEHGANAAAETLAAHTRERFPHEPEPIRLHALALLQSGQREQARQALQHAAQVAPQHIATQCNLATLELEDGDPNAAIVRLRTALRRAPGHPDILNALGTALMAAARHAQAREAFAMATHGAPTHAGVRLNLAAAELELGHAAQAEIHAREALQLVPELPAAHALLGHALRAQHRTAEAARVFLAAEQREPHNPVHAYEAGLALDDAGALDAAATAWRRALQADTGFAPALGQLVYAQRRRCDWRGLDTLGAQLRRAVDNHREGIGPFAFLAEDADAAAHRRCAETYAGVIERRMAPLRTQLALPALILAAEAPIRVGLVADGFGAHATGLLLVALIEALATSSLDVHLFATTPDDGSALRRRLARAATMHELASMNAAQSALAIHAAGIEILFDLNGYCGKDNAELMALRAAPVQVNYLAYPGTSGAPWMDYLLADATVVPDAMRPAISEKLLRLPRCYQPSDTTRAVAPAPSRSASGLPEHGTVFACFNAGYKLNPASFARFLHVLDGVPDGVLWLLSVGADGDERLRHAATEHGIAPARLVFLPHLPHTEYLARYALADLFLDTLPYNAHTTASDALWAGCPVLTLRGETFAGRVAASLLEHVGLPELIADDETAFVESAIELGQNPNGLATLHRYLAQQGRRSELFDMPGYARDFERAVQWISARHRAGLAPQDHDVAPAISR